MKFLQAKQHDVHPLFDLETYMFLAQTQTLTPVQLMHMSALWERWYPLLRAYTFGEKKGYLLVFLEHEVEAEMETLWKESEEEAFFQEALAQSMIMGTLRLFIPDLSKSKCAPLPLPDKVLKRSLRKIGIEFTNDGTFGYKYATLTYYPQQAGCEKCLLKASCPKNMGLGSQQSYTIPGETN